MPQETVPDFNVQTEEEINSPEPTVEATVEIDEGITQDALFDLPEIIDGVFTDYRIVGHYEADGQIYMMPVTSPDGLEGDKVAFVKLAAGTLLWIVDWTAEKINVRPSIPNPALGDNNLVLMDKHFQPEMVFMKPDSKGAIGYRLSGTYVYGFKDPERATLYYGRPPWMDKSVDCSVWEDQFKDGIITCSTSQQTGGGSSSPTNPDAAGTFADLGIQI